jgi:hypothetical protein
VETVDHDFYFPFPNQNSLFFHNAGGLPAAPMTPNCFKIISFAKFKKTSPLGSDLAFEETIVHDQRPRRDLVKENHHD